ncbi:MAG: hypothetical protein KatS3mg088_474 [Patescibacteria group bacterium]|nr:MAG: hypothetical protein KatS3mg088_474 [Patescibacteria group bacterium]
MKRFLFVDGTNLYAGQFSLFGPDKYLVFSDFLRFIEDAIGKKFDKIFFYASYSPRSKKLTEKEKIYLKNEYFFYKSAKLTPKLSFFRGYRSRKSGKEKGVDVKLACDLVSLSITGKYQEGFILSGDADFLEALFISKKYSKGIRQNIICLENKIMYRGSYFFPTYVIRFTGKNLKIKEKYYKFIYLDQKFLVRDLNN